MMKRYIQLSILFLLATFQLSAQVIYVDAAATGSGDGSNWANAHTDLNTALTGTQPGDSIWVATGTYFPTADGDRDKRFELSDGVKLFGGFAGTEQSIGERDWAANPTVLSGDIGVPGDSTDNSYTILYMHHVDTTTCVDGLVFRHGNADGSGGITSPSASGGAVYIDGSDGHAYPRIHHCTFEHNRASFFGGAVYVNGQDDGSVAPQFYDCTFRQNSAQSGGGIFRDGGSWTEVDNDFWDCRFEGNRAAQFGGGVLYYESERTDTIEFLECDFLENMAGNRGGGLAFYAGRSSGTKAIIEKGSFLENSSFSDGAWLYFPTISSVKTDFLLVKECDIESNVEIMGGAVPDIFGLALNSTESKISFNQCSFKHFEYTPLSIELEYGSIEVNNSTLENINSSFFLYATLSNRFIFSGSFVISNIGSSQFFPFFSLPVIDSIFI